MATKKATSNTKSTKTAAKSVTNSSKEKRAVVAAKKKPISQKTTTRKQSVFTQSVGVSPVATPKQNQLKPRRSYVIALVAAIIVLALVYQFKGLIVAATVNGAPIWRASVISQLEEQGGKQALQTLITNKLIDQAASSRHITVSQSDINNEEKTIEDNLAKQGQTLDAALAAQGMTRQNLDDQIKVQEEVQKIVGTVTISDKEVSDYMDKNKDSLPQGTTLSAVKQQLQQQELQQKEQDFVQNLQSKAKISYWVNY